MNLQIRPVVENPRTFSTQKNPTLPENAAKRFREWIRVPIASSGRCAIARSSPLIGLENPKFLKCGGGRRLGFMHSEGGAADFFRMSARILILYATQTGNAEDVAERIGREARRRRYRAVVMSMDRYEPRELPSETTVVFVASTTGQGDPPDTMKKFWSFLLRKDLDEKFLEGLHYAVFGLGDSGYPNFNWVAIKLDNRLANLGAKSIISRGLGDDQHRSGFEGALDPWLLSLWSVMQERLPTEGGPESFDDSPGFWQLDAPKYRIRHHQAPQVPVSESYTDTQRKWTEHERARAMVEDASGSGVQEVPNDENIGRVPNNPVFAQVIKNVRLTDLSHEQDVRHLEFDLGDSRLDYAPGDVLGVFPGQNDKAVTNFIERCGLDPAAYVTVEPADAGQAEAIAPVAIRSLVEAVMDISSASPRRYFFEVMMHFAQAEHEKERLQYFATSEGRDDLYTYNQRERRTVIEVLEDFPSVQLPLEWLVQIVPRLRPRYFSISSSPKAHPGEIHLTLAVVEWTTPFNRKRRGLCSNWLAQLDPKTGLVPIWVTKGILKLPPPSVPLILVGPGTGCAPFRAFIEERAALSARQSVAPVLFFFGCRYRSKDFLYEDLWTSLAKDGGVLSAECGGGFFVAFSRDQPHKVYVQHKIREQSELVWKLLENKGAVFVSGSADKMPADVAAAFEEVVVKETGAPESEARAWLKLLQSKRRYTVEVWN